MEEKNLTEAEISKINEINSRVEQLTINLGRLHMQRLELRRQVDMLDATIEKASDEYDAIINDDKILKQTLHETYGDGEILLDKGVFVSR